jgi:hypothetical protein
MSETPKRRWKRFGRSPAACGAFIGALLGLLPVGAIVFLLTQSTYKDGEGGLAAIFYALFCVLACCVYVACIVICWILGVIIQVGGPSRRESRDRAL